MYRARRQQDDQPEAGAQIPAARAPRDDPAETSGSLLSYLPRHLPAPREDPPQPAETLSQPAGPSPRSATDLWRILDWVWAGRLVVALWVIAGIVTAYGVSTVLKPRFTTYTDLTINPSQLQLSTEDLYNTNAQREAQLLAVASKMRMLTSSNVLSRVVDKLSLQTDPEFVGRADGLSPEEARFAALRSLYDRVTVRRDGQSYVATLAVWSQDPMKSVTISEAIVEAFKLEVAAANSENSQRTATAMNARLDAMRARASEASAAVETFRRENQLEGVGGELLSSQSLSQLNEQINNAREHLLQTQAQYDATRALRIGRPVNDQTPESPVLSSLRTRQAALEEELQSKSITLGPRHPTVSALSLRLKSAGRAVDAEVQRMVEIAQSEVEQAKSVLDQLVGQLAGTRSLASQDNKALSRLGELQREADVQTAIYRNYLQRMSEIAESSEVDVTDIRIISYPVPPKSRDWPPRTLYLLAAGAVGGGAIGLMWVILGQLARIGSQDFRRRLAAERA